MLVCLQVEQFSTYSCEMLRVYDDMSLKNDRTPSKQELYSPSIASL